MNMSLRSACLLVGLVVTSASLAAADEYPSRPIRLIVPYAAGGGADTVARIVAKRVGETIGQPIVIENRGGAGSIIGTDMVAKAEPDGYTLLLGQSGPISINPAVYKDLRYDPVADFSPITMTTAYPYILVINSQNPAKSLAEFIAAAKSKAGGMNYGSTGIGAANHLVAELFSSKSEMKLTHIPYKGTALAVADLLSGQIDMVFSDPISVLPHIESGKLRALGVTSTKRSTIAPEIPTIAESGFSNFEALAWHGILAPAKTPKEVVRKLNQEIASALKHPETNALLVKQAMEPVGNSADEFAAFIQKDIAIWKAVASEAKISVQ
jgi:tripartite-type tricarboxylate transporter receptor subunit TctC